MQTSKECDKGITIRENNKKQFVVVYSTDFQASS